MRNCEGKKDYPNKPMAEWAAKTMRRQTDDPVIAYHCTTCHAWHLANRTPGRRKRGRR